MGLIRMDFCKSLLAFSLFFPIAFSMPSFAEEKPSLVLLPVQGHGLDAGYLSAYRAAIAGELQKSYAVFTGESVDKKIKEIFAKESQKERCDSERCYQDIGIAFQAELVATATVINKDNDYLLSFQITNVFDSKVVVSKTDTCGSCTPSQISDRFSALLSEQAAEKLTGTEGTVFISSEPFEPGASVLVDDKATASVPAKIQLAEGAHMVEVEGKTGYGAQGINVRFGVSSSVKVQLKKYAAVMVTSEPAESGAAVLVNGKGSGAIPAIGKDPVKLLLKEGAHKIEVEGKNGKWGEATVGVGSGKSRKVVIPLAVYARVDISVDAGGEGVEIYADGKLLGVAPLKARLLEGKHTLKARKGMLYGSQDVEAKWGAKNNSAIITIHDMADEWMISVAGGGGGRTRLSFSGGTGSPACTGGGSAIGASLGIGKGGWPAQPFVEYAGAASDCTYAVAVSPIKIKSSLSELNVGVRTNPVKDSWMGLYGSLAFSYMSASFDINDWGNAYSPVYGSSGVVPALGLRIGGKHFFMVVEYRHRFALGADSVPVGLGATASKIFNYGQADGFVGFNW